MFGAEFGTKTSSRSLFSLPPCVSQHPVPRPFSHQHTARMGVALRGRVKTCGRGESGPCRPPPTPVWCSGLAFHSSPISILPVYTFANYSPCLAEPLILNHRGKCLRADTLRIEEFLTSCRVDTCLYDDMTECSWSDGGEGHLLEEEGGGPSMPQPRTEKPFKALQKQRSKKKRNAKRSEAQKALGTTVKLHVLAKYPAQSTIDAILTGFNTPGTSEITVPGWVGQPLKDLPSRAYTLTELIKGFGFRLFPWEGR